MTMVDHAHRWVRVSQRSPCPLCNKPDNCEVSRDGQMVWCGRVSADAIRQNAGGQYLHRLNELSPQPVCEFPVRDRVPRRNWTLLAHRLFNSSDEAREILARHLGVSEQALIDLRVGWDADQFHWTFPERDANGKIVGINARFRDGSKKRLYGGRAGLTYTNDWDHGHGPILMPEGASDVAALLTLGINAVGRPSNTAGVALLSELLAGLSDDRMIIVLGERDQKPDGRWPGKEGAMSTAKQLADQLDREVCWALPPDGFKDARGWLNEMPGISLDELADLFLSGLTLHRLDPPVTLHVPVLPTRVLPIDTWRERMFQTRLRSLNRPGYYLDASTTGSGKSHVDLEVLQIASMREDHT